MVVVCPSRSLHGMKYMVEGVQLLIQQHKHLSPLYLIRRHGQELM